MSEYFVGTTGSNSQTTFEAFTTSEVLDDLQLNTGDAPTFSGLFLNSTGTGANNTIFSVDGSNGRLFGVTDDVTGTIFSVNDAAGLPILEVESTSGYDKITIGEYGSDLLVLSGQTTAEVTGSQIATESWVGDQGYITSAATPNDATITISAGTALGGGGNFTTDQSANETITINHDSISRSDTTSSVSLDFGDTVTGIDSITSNAQGHITAENTVTYTLPTITSGDITGALGADVVLYDSDGAIEATEFIGDVRGAISFKAQAAESIAKGEAVYISGVSGNTTVVALADANDATKMPAFGIASEAASANNPVTVINFGSLGNLDTDTPNWDEGDELFVSTTAGALTTTAPTSESSLLQKIAKVTRRDNSAGSITVMGAGRTNAVPNLNEGRLFVGNSSNQAVADGTVHVDIANSRVGIGTTSAEHKLDVDGGAKFNTNTGTTPFYVTRLGNTNEALSISVMDNTVRFESIQDETADDYGGFDFRLDAGTTHPNFTIRKGSADPILHVDGGGNVGIGETSPSSLLHLSSSGPAVLTIEADTDNVTETDNAYINFIQDGGNLNGKVGLEGTAGVTFTDSLQNGAFLGADSGVQLYANGAAGLTLLTDGSIGIGTNAPATRLDVYKSTSTSGSSTGTPLLRLHNYVGSDLSQQKTFVDFTLTDDNGNETPQVRIGAEVGQNGDANSQAKEGCGAFVVYTNNADTDSGDAGASLEERMRVDYQGYVGIGTTSPAARLQLHGSTADSTENAFVVRDSASAALFSIRNDGRIDATGNVVIGGTLTVNGTTTTINSTTISVDDKNIELGSVATPTDTTADGGGITLKGATDKTINWVNSTSSWTSNQTFSAPNLTLTNIASSTETTALFINASNGVFKRTLGSAAFSATTDFAAASHTHSYLPLSGGTLTGDVIFDDGSGDSPALKFRDGSDINFSIYHSSSNTLLITREGNSGADFAIHANATDYTNSYISIGGSQVTPTLISNWSTAYTYSQVGHLPLAGGTMSGNLTIASTDPTITLFDNSGANTDPNGTIIFSELSGTNNFDINYNGASDRLEFRGLISSTLTDLVYIKRNSTDTVEVFGNVTASSFIKSGGTSSQFLKADGSVDSNTYLTAHPTISAASSSDNSGRTYIQDILLDSNGHVTGITTATETVTDTNTTYSAGTHLSLSGTTFNVDFATANKVVNIGHNSTNNEGEIILDTSNGGSPQISFTDHGDASWAIGVDDDDNSFKIHGSASSTIPTINGLVTPLFEITTGGIGYLGTNRLFADNYHPNADKLTAARTISLGGDLSGSASFDGSANVTITAAVADDSHNHIISNVDGLQTALDGKASSTHNHTLDSLSNVTITSNTSGEVLRWSGSAWINSTLSEAGIQASSTALTTSTTFGGDVSGTYNAIVVANDSHTHNANNLTGTTLASGVTASSLTSVGTITSGTWNGTVIDSDYIGGRLTKKISGDGTTTNFTVTHSFGTPRVMTQILDYGDNGTGATYEVINTTVKRSSDNAISVVFGTAPTSSEDYLVLMTEMPAIS